MGLEEEQLDTARAEYGRRAWSAARSAYAAAGEPSLTLDDIERYAIASHLVGHEAEFRELYARGHRQALQLDDVTRAVRFAFWLGYSLFFTGEAGQASGWFARARSLLDERGADCVEWGYLLIPRGVEPSWRARTRPPPGDFSKTLAPSGNASPTATCSR
jgi:hypothetical protein